MEVRISRNDPFSIASNQVADHGLTSAQIAKFDDRAKKVIRFKQALDNKEALHLKITRGLYKGSIIPLTQDHHAFYYEDLASRSYKIGDSVKYPNYNFMKKLPNSHWSYVDYIGGHFNHITEVNIPSYVDPKTGQNCKGGTIPLARLDSSDFTDPLILLDYTGPSIYKFDNVARPLVFKDTYDYDTTIGDLVVVCQAPEWVIEIAIVKTFLTKTKVLVELVKSGKLCNVNLVDNKSSRIICLCQSIEDTALMLKLSR